jgi:hypothetical protein
VSPASPLRDRSAGRAAPVRDYEVASASCDAPLGFRVFSMAATLVERSATGRFGWTRVTSMALSSRLDDPSKRAFSSIDSERWKISPSRRRCCSA